MAKKKISSILHAVTIETFSRAAHLAECLIRRRGRYHGKRSRRQFTQEFKDESVQMLLDGHSAATVAQRLGLSGTNILYSWKRQSIFNRGPIGGALEQRVRELEDELRRTQRERDILKKALAIFGRNE